ETGRGELEHSIRGRDWKSGCLGTRKISQALLSEQGGFGKPGRAGSVDDIGQRGRRQMACEERGGRQRLVNRVLIEAEMRESTMGEERQPFPGCKEHGRRTIAQQKFQALGRSGGVKR